MDHSPLLLVLVFTLVLFNIVLSYPEGAPERACYIMIPRHTNPYTRRPVKAHLGRPPYNITISRNVFNPDIPVTVTIQGIRGAPFKGFFIIAGEEGSKDWPVGVFRSYTNRARSIYCSFRNDAATHSDGKWKESITLDWYAPAHTAADHIQFIATVVTNQTTYWTDIRSALMTQDPNVQEAAEGGVLPGGSFGAGAGVDAWGYPTTPAYNTFGGEGGRGGSGGAFGRGGGGLHNLFASLMGFGGWGRGFGSGQTTSSSRSWNWRRGGDTTTSASTWENRATAGERGGSNRWRNNNSGGATDQTGSTGTAGAVKPTESASRSGAEVGSQPSGFSREGSSGNTRPPREGTQGRPTENSNSWGRGGSPWRANSPRNSWFGRRNFNPFSMLFSK